MKFVSLAFALALLAGGATVLSAATPGRVSYTAAQATQGRALYYGKCALCHGANMQGINGPALKGSDSNLKQQKIGAVYSYITIQMPVGNAGGLPSSEYVKLMAYILQSNGVPAGKKAATPASLKSASANI